MSIESLVHEQRLQFWLNIYHTLLIQAHLEIAKFQDLDRKSTNTADLSKVARISLFRSAAYRIGGYRYSLLDIEHAVLRAQTSAPSIVILALGGRLLVPKFKSKKDPRSACALEKPVPEVVSQHLALLQFLLMQFLLLQFLLMFLLIAHNRHLRLVR